MTGECRHHTGYAREVNAHAGGDSPQDEAGGVASELGRLGAVATQGKSDQEVAPRVGRVPRSDSASAEWTIGHVRGNHGPLTKGGGGLYCCARSSR